MTTTGCTYGHKTIAYIIPSPQEMEDNSENGLVKRVTCSEEASMGV